MSDECLFFYLVYYCCFGGSCWSPSCTESKGKHFRCRNSLQQLILEHVWMQRTLLLKHSTHLLYIHYWAWPLLAKPVSWGKCLCRNCSEAVKGVKVVPSALVLQQHEGLSFCRKSCSACKKATIHVIIIIHHHRSKGTFLLDHEWHIDLQDCIPLFTIRIASKNWNLPQFWKHEISIWLPYIIDGVVFFVQKESNTAGGYKLRLSKHSKLQLDENCAQTRHRLSRILPCRAVPRGKKHSCLFWGGNDGPHELLRS